MRRWRVCVIGGLLACALGVGRMAAAQSTPPSNDRPDPRRDARTRLGPFYMTPAFEIRNAGVDTNVFNSPESPESDMTVTATPQVDVWVPFARRALVTTSVSAGLVYFKKFESERSVDPEALFRADLYTRRVTFFLEDTIARSRQRPNEEIDARSSRTTNSAAAGVILRVGSRLSAELAAFQTRLEYDQDAVFLGTSLRQSLTHREEGVRAIVRQRLTSFTTFMLTAESERSRFQFSPERDADGFRVSSGFEFSPRALISGSAEVGARRFETKDATLPDFTGVVASADLRYVMIEPTSLALGVAWDRDVSYSFEPTQPYYVSNAVGASVGRQIVGRLDARLSGARSTSAYRSFDTGSATAARTDVTLSWSVDIGYRMNRDLRVGIAATSMRRRSQGTTVDRDYEGMRIGMSVSYRVPG